MTLAFGRLYTTVDYDGEDHHRPDSCSAISLLYAAVSYVLHDPLQHIRTTLTVSNLNHKSSTSAWR